jgi:hypothetical protein
MVLAAVGVLFVAAFAPAALAQKKGDIEKRVKNIEGDLEVLKDFIQEQTQGLKEAKDKIAAETERATAETDKVDKKVVALATLTSQVSENLTALQKEVEKQAADIAAIKAELEHKKVNFSGQFRVRPEVVSNLDDFHSQFDEDQNLRASERLRIGMDVAPVAGVSARFVLQDVRGWGVQAAGDDPSDPLRVHEAYLSVQLDPEVATLSVGRQAWDFGRGRMIGNNDWDQRGRSFDGLDLTLKYENFIRADILYSIVDERNTAEGTDAVFGGVYATCPYLEGVTFDGYLLYLGDDREIAKRKIGTLGLRAGGVLPTLKEVYFDAEATLQFGTVTEVAPVELAAVGEVEGTGKEYEDADHFAAAYHLEAGYKSDDMLIYRPQFGVFFDSASGDNNTSPADAKNDGHYAFVPLFPSLHDILGKMDLWTLTNVWDIGARAGGSPVEGLELHAEFHYLSLVYGLGRLPRGNAVHSSLVPKKDKAGEANLDAPTAIGAEIDLDLSYRVNPSLALMLGYSVFLPAQDGAIPEQVFRIGSETDENDLEHPYKYPGGDPAHWLFVQADFTF